MSVFAYRQTVKGDLDALSGGTIEVAFTNSESDLGDAQGDVARDGALAALGRACGVLPQAMRQVHGTRIRVISDHAKRTPPEADGLVTGQLGLALVVRVADCVPVLLADPRAGIIAATHAGRVGLAAGVVMATLEEMQREGAAAIRAWVGPHICGACYEVPHQMRAEIASVVPSTYATSRWRTPALDIGAGVISQLTDAGCDVRVVPGCTFEDPQWHSFRRDGATSGRMAGFIWKASP